MALFMLANNLTCEDVLSPGRDISFPGSVIDLISGGMGQPPGGFPEAVKQRILLGKQEFTGRPGETLPPADLDAARSKVASLLGRVPSGREVISWLLYERVFEEFAAHQDAYSDVSILPTPNFFFGLETGEEIAIDIEPGKHSSSDCSPSVTPTPMELEPSSSNSTGNRAKSQSPTRPSKPPLPLASKPIRAIAGQIGATMPGMVVNVAVRAGDRVRKGQKLISLEAMKMETAVNAELDGTVREVSVQPGCRVETGDLLLIVDPA
jgi:pyruvate carboxylase